MERRQATLFATLAAFAVVALGGCSDAEVELAFSAGPEWGLCGPLAGAVVRAIQAESPHIKVKVIESRGSQENVDRIERREADLAFAQNDSRGTPAIRSLAPVYRDVLHFLTTRDSPIERLADIQGARVAVGEEGSGTEKLVGRLTRHYGLSFDDFEPMFLGPNAATEQLVGGKIDAMLFMVGLRSPACERAVSSGQVRFVGLGEAGIDAGEVAGFRLEYPFVEPFVRG